MKAVSVMKYGGPEVLEIREAPVPKVDDRGVLIRVMATVAAVSDCAFRSGKPALARVFTGLVRPGKIPGDVFAGVVESVGRGATRFQPGDRVYGSSGEAFGTNAEYLVLTEDAAIEKMPAGIGFLEAACVSEGAITALPFLRDGGHIAPGKKVLINGASGGVGVYALQLARHFGAKVTAVCGPENLSLVRELGADEAVDYTKEDFTACGETYDIIFDAVAKSSFSRCERALAPGGVYLTTFPSPGVLLKMLLTGRSRGKRAVFMATGLRKPEEKRKDLLYLNELMEAGKLKPVIGRTFRWQEMAEAHRYVESGHKRGSVAVVIGEQAGA